MPIDLIPDLTRAPQDGEWTFGLRRTRAGSDIVEMLSRRIPEAIVTSIYLHAVGPAPSTGLELPDILRNWSVLEPLFRAEIEGTLEPG